MPWRMPFCRYAHMVLDLADEVSESDANPVLGL
jgi:hypothetical protein